MKKTSINNLVIQLQTIEISLPIFQIFSK